MKKFLKVILPIFIVTFSLFFVACKKNTGAGDDNTNPPAIDTPIDNPTDNDSTTDDTVLENKVVKKIELLTDIKTNYYVGDSMESTEIKIKVTYENQTSEEITITKDMISGFDTSTAGNKKITITYKEKSVEASYTVTAVKATKFAVNQTLKATYYTGDEFEQNITLSVTYNNGTIKNSIPLESSMISGFDTSEPGDKKFTITIENISREFDYSVELLVLTNVELASDFKTTYFVGETLDTTNGKLKLTYNSGKIETVSIAGLGDEIEVNNFKTTMPIITDMQILYKDFRVVVPYTVKNVELTSIEITAPFKLEYFEGDPLDTTGGKLKLTYNNNTTETIDITESMVQNFNTSTSGTKKLTIYHNGKHVDASYTVKELVATSLEIKSSFKTRYLKNETLCLDGGTIEYVLNNGDTAIIAINESMISGFLSTSTGMFEMSITCYSKTITVPYEIYEITATGITLKTGFKNTYLVGDSVDTTGGEITVTYSDGSTQDIAITSDMIKNFTTNLASEKTKTMKIKYAGFTIDYSYTVSEATA